MIETAKPISCFLHVPKSGGTALTLYLRSVLGNRQVFHVGEGRYRHAPLEGLMKRYPVITGHFNVGQIPERLFETTFFFTFLREPVDRIVSMYHFFKEGDLDSDHRVVIAEEWSLERALDKWARPGSCSSWSNEQTFLFSGATDPAQPPEILLPLALRNLERFDFVGVYEQFAAGVECLGRMRGWPLDAPVPRFKTSRNRLAVGEMDPALVERIREVNGCDVQLYARARELWEGVRQRARNLPAAVAGSSPLTADRSVQGLLPRVETGTQEIVFSSADVFDLRTGGDAVIQFGNPTEVRLGVCSPTDTDDIHVGLRISDEADLEVYGVDTRLRGRALSLEAAAITTVRFVFDMYLAPGAYYLSVFIQGGGSHDEKLFHRIDNVTPFWCVDEHASAFTGLVDLRARLKVANPVFPGQPEWWRPPEPVRRGLAALKKKFTPLPRPPKLVRYLIRTVKNEGWGALKYFLSGKTPPGRQGRP